MLQLQFVDVHGNIGIPEMLEAAGVVEVEMAHDDGFDILDVVACLLYLDFKLLVRGVVDLAEDVVDRSTPNFRIVLAAASLEKDEALRWMLDQNGDDDHLAAFWVGLRMRQCCGSALVLINSCPLQY